MSQQHDVLILGGEPAAFACADILTAKGVKVAHLYGTPFGLLGASRDIGLAYPEMGEPWERLRDALGEEIGKEFHQWGKAGVESLTGAAHQESFFRRGSRIAVSRTEQEASLSGTDALDRQQIGDEVRLMSGAAASNYAPVIDLLQASFETHAAAFPPVPMLEFLAARLAQRPSYYAQPLTVAQEWQSCQLQHTPQGPQVRWGESETLQAEVVVVAAARESARFLNGFGSVLVSLPGQAFRTPPLREVCRSSVVGVTGSWGYERFRFDPEQRLVGCGINPSGGLVEDGPAVNEKSLEVFFNRSRELFMDLFCELDEVLQWGVEFTVSCDGLPVLGPLSGQPRVQVIAGFSTSAWSRGYRAGEVVAEALTQEKYHNPLLARCSPRRFL